MWSDSLGAIRGGTDKPVDHMSDRTQDIYQMFGKHMVDSGTYCRQVFVSSKNAEPLEVPQ